MSSPLIPAFFYHNGAMQSPKDSGSFRRLVCNYYNPDGKMKRVVQIAEVVGSWSQLFN